MAGAVSPQKPEIRCGAELKRGSKAGRKCGSLLLTSDGQVLCLNNEHHPYHILDVLKDTVAQGVITKEQVLAIANTQNENKEEKEMTQTVEQKEVEIKAVAKMLEALALNFEAKVDLSKDDFEKLKYAERAKLARSLHNELPQFLKYGIEIRLLGRNATTLFLVWDSSWDKSFTSSVTIEIEACWANYTLQKKRESHPIISLECFSELTEVGCYGPDGVKTKLPYITLKVRGNPFPVFSVVL